VPAFGAESGRAYRAMILRRAWVPGMPFRGPVLVLSGSADRIVPGRTSATIARLYAAQHEVFDHGTAQEVAGRTLARRRGLSRPG
jgi:hypothetical protein